LFTFAAPHTVSAISRTSLLFILWVAVSNKTTPKHLNFKAALHFAKLWSHGVIEVSIFCYNVTYLWHEHWSGHGHGGHAYKLFTLATVVIAFILQVLVTF